LSSTICITPVDCDVDFAAVGPGPWRPAEDIGQQALGLGAFIPHQTENRCLYIENLQSSSSRIIPKSSAAYEWNPRDVFGLSLSQAAILLR
jgi:hypothetical protein